jgi:GST-like protein
MRNKAGYDAVRPARPAAARTIALKDKFTFKADMDDEAKYIMLGHLKTRVA